MRRLAAAMLVFSLSCLPAWAEDPFWMSLEADDGTKAGLVFPDYQPNNFSVFWMVCAAEQQAAQLIFEFPIDNLREGMEMPVSFIIDDEEVAVSALGIHDDFQGSMILQATLSRDDPLLDRLAKASSIVIKVAAIEFATPIKGAWSAINNFTNLCRAS